MLMSIPEVLSILSGAFFRHRFPQFFFSSEIFFVSILLSFSIGKVPLNAKLASKGTYGVQNIHLKSAIC